MEVLRKQFLFSIAHTPQMLWPELKKKRKKNKWKTKRALNTIT